MPSITDIAQMIDHSILHPTLGVEHLKKECEVAAKYEVASVCVKPYAVKLATEFLKGTHVKIGSVIGFPAGNSLIETKVFECRKACEDGAVEIDMVINIAKALEGDWDYIEKEIMEITEVCHSFGAINKVIFETDFVTEPESIIRLCQICTAVKADYVKTSTGFGFVKGADGKYSYSGATIPNLKLMKGNIGPEVKLKAAGGVRTLDSLLEVREVGCSRVGATATIAIMEEAKKRFS